MFVVFEKNGAIFLVSLCPIAKSSTTKSRFARLDYAGIHMPNFKKIGLKLWP